MRLFLAVWGYAGLCGGYSGGRAVRKAIEFSTRVSAYPASEPGVQARFDRRFDCRFDCRTAWLNSIHDCIDISGADARHSAEPTRKPREPVTESPRLKGKAAGHPASAACGLGSRGARRPIGRNWLESVGRQRRFRSEDASIPAGSRRAPQENGLARASHPHQGSTENLISP